MNWQSVINGESRWSVDCADCLEWLRKLPDNSVNCCVTSPPYWGLRDYGHAGQIGLEKTPQEYVGKIVDIFRELRRVLTKDGTLWLNLGDSYNGSGGVGATTGKQLTNRGSHSKPNNRAGSDFAKPKDLIGIPWMVAFALRADGWYLRQDIIWAKPNPMPESVTDRCTKAHEYIFLLTKSARYYYDAEAIQEPAIWGDPRKPYAPGQVDNRGNGHARNGGKIRQTVERGGFNGKTNTLPGREAFRAIEDYRNKRSVWTVTTTAYPGAHFAVYPPELIKPCILAGCPDNGIVIDPFVGSGTTLQVALDHNRRAIGCELNPDYIKLIENRMSGVTPAMF